MKIHSRLSSKKVYLWHGINQAGQHCHGVMMAHNSSQLQQNLQSQNIIMTHAKRQVKIPFFRKPQTRINMRTICDFTHRLATLLGSGIQLEAALTIMIDNLSYDPLTQLLKKIKQRVMDGDSLSQALTTTSTHFNQIYCNMVAAGEQSGNLATTLQQLDKYLNQRYMLIKKIKKSAFYPGVVLVVAIIISSGLLIFIVPQFSAVFANMGAELPWLSQVVIKGSTLLRQHGMTLLMFMTLVTIGCRHYDIKNKLSKRLFYQILMKLPPVKHLLITHQLMIWLNLAATLCHAGLPLTQIIATCNQVLTIPTIRQTMQQIEHQLQQGQTLAQCLQQCQLLPKQVIQLITVGENTGELAAMLDNISQDYQQKLTDQLALLSQLLEPLIMIGLAIFIGGLIIAMYLPIFDIGTVV